MGMVYVITILNDILLIVAIVSYLGFIIYVYGRALFIFSNVKIIDYYSFNKRPLISALLITLFLPIPAIFVHYMADLHRFKGLKFILRSNDVIMEQLCDVSDMLDVWYNPTDNKSIKQRMLNNWRKPLL